MGNILRSNFEGITFDEYQALTESTAIYPEAGSGSELALAYAALGLGESGEVQGKIKKIIRDDGGIVTTAKRTEIKKELGDILWYVGRVARELNLSLSDVAADNLIKLLDRKERDVLGGSGDNR